ncbi:MAG: CmpA/NrtA family ABC transporter substrate-binding protein [Verrucomicrobiales bacterium]
MEPLRHAIPAGHRQIRLSYVPLTDAAPLIIAKEFGLFAERGLAVELVREPGWATVRDKLVHGREIHGAHALAGLAFATSFGIQCIARHCVTGLILNRHGNGVTLSRELRRQGVREIADLNPGQLGRGGRRLRLGIVHPVSSHHYLLRTLFGRRGMKLSEQAEVIVLPPELMAKSLGRGMIDGFCVGEPWNSEAIENGTGFCFATSSELCDSHPEKVLLVTAEFAEERHDEHIALLGALIQACQLCDDLDQRPEIARLLSSPAYLDLPLEIVQNSLCGRFHRGMRKYSPVESIHAFSGEPVNRPSVEKANLVLATLRGSGLSADGGGASGRPATGAIFRDDLYEEACRHAGQAVALTS